MLHLAVGRFARTFCPGAVFAGIDATGFETRHATSYYTWRAQIRHEYTKLSACSDMGTQLVMAVKCGRGTEHNVSHVPELFSRVRRMALPLRAVVMDKGYDAEWVHEAVRDASLRAVVPVRRQRWGSRTHSRHRRQMQREFESGVAHEAYSQRSKAETIFSVIKRMFGSGLRSHSYHTRETELLYRVLAYNCHRACVISCVVLVMISMEPRRILRLLGFSSEARHRVRLGSRLRGRKAVAEERQGGHVRRQEAWFSDSPGRVHICQAWQLQVTVPLSLSGDFQRSAL